MDNQTTSVSNNDHSAAYSHLAWLSDETLPVTLSTPYPIPFQICVMLFVFGMSQEEVRTATGCPNIGGCVEYMAQYHQIAQEAVPALIIEKARLLCAYRLLDKEITEYSPSFLERLERHFPYLRRINDAIFHFLSDREFVQLLICNMGLSAEQLTALPGLEDLDALTERERKICSRMADFLDLEPDQLEEQLSFICKEIIGQYATPAPGQAGPPRSIKNSELRSLLHQACRYLG